MIDRGRSPGASGVKLALTAAFRSSERLICGDGAAAAAGGD
jgi:hypothetical protein